VLEAYGKEKKRAGYLDFTDQESLLYELLAKDSIGAQLKENLKLIVVDEFQDTNPIQLALFTRLAQLAETSYWVGDLKQTIYEFRGSDATLMSAVLSALEAQGTKPDILEYSWRSRPSLVELANDVFIPAFSDELPEEQVRLKPQRGETEGPSFMHWILPGSNAELRNSQLAQGIRSLHDQGNIPIQWSHIAVLARSKEDVQAISRSCRSIGIPVRSTTMGLLRTPEATLTIACLRRLNDSHDTLASAEILSLTQGLSPEDWLEERLEWLEKHGESKQGKWRCEGEGKGEYANPVLRALESMKALVRTLSPLELLDECIAQCALDRLILSFSPDIQKGRERLTNLEGIRELVRKYEADSASNTGTLSGLLRWLESIRDTEDPFPESTLEAITVSTWHKAKGLEWPVVILTGCNKGLKPAIWDTLRVLRDGPLDLQNPLKGAWIRLWPWPFGRLESINGLNTGSDPEALALINRNKQEERRLLYVGLTRARDMLIVAKKNKTTPQEAGVTVLGKGMDLFWNERPGTDEITLGNGMPLPYQCLTLSDTSPSQGAAVPNPEPREPLKWYKTCYEPVPYPKARIIPSEESRNGSLGPGTMHRLATVLPRRAFEDMRETGTLYHRAFAFYAHNPDRCGSPQLEENFKPVVLEMLNLMKQLWPQGIFHTEMNLRVPIQDNPPLGQYIDARLDLLVETPDGYYILDHKLSEKPEESPQKAVSRYGSQLALYAQAVQNACAGVSFLSPKPVRGLWLAIPQDGLLMEVIAPPLQGPP
jgi:ATP-dependent exoDNAse (exonuclease V) beta subunit